MNEDAMDHVTFAMAKKKVAKALQKEVRDLQRVLGQVINIVGLASADLVHHDLAFNLGANWVSKNIGFIRNSYGFLILGDCGEEETTVRLSKAVRVYGRRHFRREGKARNVGVFRRSCWCGATLSVEQLTRLYIEEGR
ncbi:hypothetical protein L1987_16915 [Smallanthus sonchifolius]|uniref:Uncharacterized protein n=1 Tax=Smallanthus sonchifolius TaxID=185202 RepID=A0ACB9IXK5_9ASTR|nr:hypothetical protein L1987_16915 [Smallanthus sonchifolius]